MIQYPKWLRDAASKGGQATGAAKRRGNSAHYKRISKLAAKARKAKSGNDELCHGDEPPGVSASPKNVNGSYPLASASGSYASKGQ